MAVRRTRTLLGAIGAAASFLVAATGTAAADPPTPAPACTMTVAFVAGADPAPTGDASLRSAVNSAAGDPSCVTTVLDSAATGWFLDTFGIVVVSSSVHLDRLPADLTATTRPVVVSEPYLFDDFGLTAGPGSETTGTTVAVRAGKLTGRTTTATAPVLTTAGPVNVARPLAGATIGATLPGAPIRVALFGSYDDARANRVGLFAGYGAVLTATGRDLVHAALDWAYNRLPRHDDFADAVTVTGPSGSRTVDHSGATLQPGEPAPADGRDRSVWYRWTAPADGVLMAGGPAHLGGDVQVFTGTSLGALVTAPAVPDGWLVTGGRTYRWQLAMFSNWNPNIVTFGWQLLPRPSNDRFAAARLLSGPAGSVTGDNRGATVEANEPAGPTTCDQDFRSWWVPEHARTVWYTWVAPAAGRVFFELHSPQPDDPSPDCIHLFRGGSVGSLTPLGTGRYANAEVSVAAGQRLRIRVSSTCWGQWWCEGSSGGPFELRWHFGPAPAPGPNDRDPAAP